MAKIISIGTALPAHRHRQEDILRFMERAYGIDERERRILGYLYRHSGIDTRYSVIPDYTSAVEDHIFFPATADLEPFPSLEKRMEIFRSEAPVLSVRAAEQCLENVLDKKELTHLITVSCTGLSAPGLEMMVMEMMQLSPSVNRSAINFMGCYAAVHALKQAADIVTANPGAKVLIICTELCTLHFQKTYSEETVTAPLLFADGSAAVLVTGNDFPANGLVLESFYAEIMWNAKEAMSWNPGSFGFNMTLSGEVPELIQRDFKPLYKKAAERAGCTEDEVRYWCIHPGGVRILQAVCDALSLADNSLDASFKVLREYGNMSSATLLFVLKEMMSAMRQDKGAKIFAAAFGPGLAMESMIMSVA
ncbi:type III polyketide synthase [Chitinophagaceae bacterium MMS25-I14]